LVRVAVFTGGALSLALTGVNPIRVLFLAALIGLLWPDRKAA